MMYLFPNPKIRYVVNLAIWGIFTLIFGSLFLAYLFTGSGKSTWLILLGFGGMLLLCLFGCLYYVYKLAKALMT